MTCEKFNTILHEISTDRTVDGQLGRDARLHAEECDVCTGLLARQRRVSTLLADLAAADADLDAPDRVEATVLGAFRLAHGTANVVPLHPVAASPAVVARRFSTRWMSAAAAIVIGVAATLVTWQAMRNGPVVVPDAKSSTSAGETAGKSEPNRTVTPPAPPRPPIDREYPRSVSGRGDGRGPIIPVSTHSGGRQAPRSTPALPVSEPQELVTDFYSLVPASGFEPMEGGQLVRLEVPRSSLASLGVPIPMGNPNGSVTADLVVGYDGVAHAIRFVQPTTTDERRNR